MSAGTEVDPHIHEESYAISLDEQDPLRHFRSEFYIPSKSDLKRKTLAPSTGSSSGDTSESIYLCGNSLGLQPRQTPKLVADFLQSWATKAVTGHFTGHEDAPHIPPYLHVDDYAAELMAPVVGAKTEEVVCMGTLTANLHFMMSSFYRPDPKAADGRPQGRYKIILEGKAFPSDHFAIESAIRLEGHDPADAMILIEPRSPYDPILSTARILRMIDTHATTTALILLPGIQFYTGQYFDIPTITSYAHSKGILVGWDLAHAVGNVPVELHDWDVDFAVWCTYKYLNSGPGAIAGLFVHERHGKKESHPTAVASTRTTEDGFEVMGEAEERPGYRPRLAGWWGADKSTRFAMDNNFVPRPGASGFQLSNPSALDLTSVISSLLIYQRASRIPTSTSPPQQPQTQHHHLHPLRTKSLSQTTYLHHLLSHPPPTTPPLLHSLFTILTPSDPSSRGAQLSLRLHAPHHLTALLPILDRESVIIDERKPDVIRVAPAPLYNSYRDCWAFANVWWNALREIVTREEWSISCGGGGGGGRQIESLSSPSSSSLPSLNDSTEREKEEEEEREGGKSGVLYT